MSTSAWGLLALFLGVLLITAWPLGIWLTRISTGRLPGWMHRVESPQRTGGVGGLPAATLASLAAAESGRHGRRVT